MNPAVNAALGIDGWMTEVELRWLADRAAKCDRVVEFGSHKGRSTKALAMSTPGKVYAVDIWNDPEVFRQFRSNLAEEILAGKVVPCKVTTRAFFFADKLPADMVFIDANHGEEAVYGDILSARDILRPGGLLCGHDFSPGWPGVKRAVLKNVPGFEVALGTTIWFTEGGAL